MSKKTLLHFPILVCLAAVATQSNASELEYKHLLIDVRHAVQGYWAVHNIDPEAHPVRLISGRQAACLVMEHGWPTGEMSDWLVSVLRREDSLVVYVEVENPDRSSWLLVLEPATMPSPNEGGFPGLVIELTESVVGQCSKDGMVGHDPGDTPQCRCLFTCAESSCTNCPYPPEEDKPREYDNFAIRLFGLGEILPLWDPAS